MGTKINHSWKKGVRPKRNKSSNPEHISKKEAPGIYGLVVARYGAHIKVEDEHRQQYRCTTRKRVSTIVCGDRVNWLPGPHKTGVILNIEPRNSLLARPDDRGKIKPLAANIDQLFIVIAATTVAGKQSGKSPNSIDFHLLDRYIAAAEASSIQPVIVVNKIDLLDKESLTNITLRFSLYQRIGYRIITTSCKTKEGLDTLKSLLIGSISVFVGQSGVGKSSLIDLYIPEHHIRTGAVSELTGLGRHTTTLTSLYHCPEGGDVIDSPGVREFGLWNMNAAEVAAAFIEFRHYLSQCKFNNCRHMREPGCSVKQGVTDRKIDAARYRSYQAIIQSLEN